jgi:hypothetical protein
MDTLISRAARPVPDPALEALHHAVVADPGLGLFLLTRLTSLAARQVVATDRRERTALAHAAFSVFLDCLDLGLGMEARRVLMRTAATAPARVAA